MTAFRADLVLLLPSLRNFARGLCKNAALADDLAQETCVSAIAHSNSFVRGSNMRAWLFTILRNQYFSHLRKHHREVEDADGSHASGLSTKATQNDSMDLDDALRAMQLLPREQRDTLMLVGPLGFSIEEAAASSHCAEGTIKSRAHRGRTGLAQQLHMSETVTMTM